MTSRRCARSCSLVASFLVTLARNLSASSKDVRLITFSSAICNTEKASAVSESDAQHFLEAYILTVPGVEDRLQASCFLRLLGTEMYKSLAWRAAGCPEW